MNDSNIDWSNAPEGELCLLQREVNKLFTYDPETGSLKWKGNHQKRFNGREAGFVNHHGYRRVGLGKTKLHAHQIIWLMHHGYLPACEIDHINGIRDDNRLENLRLATQQQNQQNSGVRIDNALGIKGVRIRPSGKYQARVKLSDGSRAVKTFCSATEAVSWLALQREMSHGEYANTPEQIAAEEREKAVSEMADTLRIQLGANYRDDLARLYCFILCDAGYRKHDAQQLHDQRLSRLAEIDIALNALLDANMTARTNVQFRELQEERDEILSHYREPQA